MNTRIQTCDRRLSIGVGIFFAILLEATLVWAARSEKGVVPFIDDSRAPVVRGTFRGAAGNFVLDLSSQNSWLSNELSSKQLNLKKSHKLQIGDRVFDLRFRMASLPDNQGGRFKIMGILGQDFFRQALVTINFAERTVQFHPKRATLESTSVAQSELMPLAVSQEGVLVPILMNKNRKFDSHYTLELASQKSSLRAQDLTHLESKDVRVIGEGVVPDLSGDGKPEAAVEVELKSLGLSDNSTQAKFRALAVKQRTGNIGLDYLERFRTTIDLKGGKIAIAPASPPNKH